MDPVEQVIEAATATAHVGGTAVLHAQVNDVVMTANDSDWKCLAGHAGPRLG